MSVGKLVMCVLALAVCEAYVFQAGQSTGEVDDTPPQIRDFSGSCKGRCFELKEAEPPSCRCDNLCKTYLSCCSDFDEQCLKTAGGFECSRERCGEIRNEDYACHCSDDCLQRGDCCTNYRPLCKGDSSWLEGDCEEIQSPECPAGFVRPPLIILSLDGFRSSYMKKGKSVLPNLHKLRSCGTHAPHMRPMYPSKTFPNLYTLATGLYPESHGIVCNSMYDPVFKAHFRLRGREKLDHRWWGGQPIWITAEKQGVKAGTFFWPWVIPLERRILTILQWLHLPDDERPYVYAVHSEQPDTYGHILGPLSNELDNTLRKIDNIIGHLMNGLKQMNLHRCVNVILVGDHGMEESHCERTEYLSSYGLDVDAITLIPGSSGRIGPKNANTSYDPKEIVSNLTCKMPNQHFKPYLKQHLPKRLHYANNSSRSPATCGFFGDHGFDNKISSMQTIFLGFGPSFNFKTEVPVFENIELYNVMCDLLGLTPAPNNGTHGSLNSVLRSPHYTPTQPEEVTSPTPLAPPSEVTHDLGCNCDDENNIEESSQRFPSAADGLLNNVTHLPFGRPAALFQTSYTQLCHSDYCSGYSHIINMPLWSAFTLTAQVEVPAVSSSECVRADPRLDHTHTCNSYSQEPDVTHAFLYPPDFSITAESRYEASLITNTVPMYPAFKRVWSFLQRDVLRRYSQENNGINVIMGPIFDHDHDGLRDTEEKIKEHTLGSVFIPTHFYSIISSCEKLNEMLEECDGDLRVTCFILPHRADNRESCNSWEDESRWVEDLLKLHTARVRDVELLTGLDFYRSTALPYTRVLALKTRMRTFEDDV
ncbi:ectonucleotide pyrophosphatase/phosphodiesterase family member 2-like [Sinocyclocheilus anshuiensis]|uniref:ectonucleotide pyrophosphatase/phosphodiesterase family member 2-like n=1 Tax=Sinocyclocheilus anshuiensis TaxID=1608454 RepID=UPI0007BA195B|nr:PREDICTED: ectonucleotide pyrophosphatase/phosphodiesterase family member 2-like [Sinocyclocheilus anshuiensis]